MARTKTLTLALSLLLGLGIATTKRDETSLPVEEAISPAAPVALELPEFLTAPSPFLRLPEGDASLLPPPGLNFITGGDLNGSTNPFIQPQNPALAGNGRDQTQKFFDLLIGAPQDYNIINGRLGADVMVGGSLADVFVGGLEHFNPENRDKAFGGWGDDTFLWKPGDGSDFFDGGAGLDAVVFGVIGEQDPTGAITFQVVNDQQAGDLWIDPILNLPRVNVSGSPGFCEVIDGSTSASSSAELASLGVDHLVRFVIRSVRDDFENGVQNTDNGLRVTLSLKSVEFLVCTNRNGGQIEVFDLRQEPPVQIPLNQAPALLSFMVQ